MRLPNALAGLARGLALATAIVAATFAAPATARADQITALVPAYFYPTWWSGSPWDQLNAAAAKIPIEAIMNPASGPGGGVNSDYVHAVNALRAAGGKVIGYVSTSYGSRPAADVFADIDAYLEWYSVDGIFLDEMGNQLGDLDYTAIYQYIKLKSSLIGRDLHVVGNPGTPFAPTETYLQAADTLVIFEGPLTNPDPNGASFKLYPTKGPYTGLPLWFQCYPRERFANLVYGVPTPLTMLAALVKAVGYNAGYVFLTNDQLPNPWDTLPPYWDQEVNAIRAVNALLAECEAP